MTSTLTPIIWNPIKGFDDSSPEHLVRMDMATEMFNVEIVEGGFSKRDGTEAINTTILSATAGVWSWDTLNLSNGNSFELLGLTNGKVKILQSSSITAEALAGFSTSAPIYSTQILDEMIYADGTTAMRTFDGSTSGTLTASPFGKYICTHLEKLWVAGIVGNLSLLSSSATGDAGTFSGAGTIDVNVSQNDGQVIKGIASFKNAILMIYKSQSTYKLVGNNNANFQVLPVDKSRGCAEHRTIKDVGDFHIFVGDNGVYISDSNEVKKVSDYQDTIWSTRNKTKPEIMTATLYREKGEYIVSFPVGSSSSNSVTLTYYYRNLFTDEQGRVHIPCVRSDLVAAILHTSKINSTMVDIMYIGDYSGFVKKRTTAKNDNGTSIDSYMSSPMFTSGAISQTVNLRRAFLPVSTNIGNIEAQYNYKEDTTSWVTAESLMGKGGSIGDPIGISFEIGVSPIGFTGDDTYIQRVNYNGVQNNRVKIRFYQDSDIRTWQINGPIELHVKSRGHKTAT